MRRVIGTSTKSNERAEDRHVYPGPIVFEGDARRVRENPLCAGLL